MNDLPLRYIFIRHILWVQNISYYVCIFVFFIRCMILFRFMLRIFVCLFGLFCFVLFCSFCFLKGVFGWMQDFVKDTPFPENSCLGYAANGVLISKLKLWDLLSYILYLKWRPCADHLLSWNFIEFCCQAPRYRPHPRIQTIVM